MSEVDQPQVALIRIGDICARYDGRWKIDGIVASDAMYTAQRRGSNGRPFGPLLRAADATDLARQLAAAELRTKGSAPSGQPCQ